VGGGVGGRLGWSGWSVVGFGRVTGMRRASFTVRSPKNCSSRSSTTAGFLRRSIYTSVSVSFLHITII
jgi:hypothetical protein